METTETLNAHILSLEHQQLIDYMLENTLSLSFKMLFDVFKAADDIFIETVMRIAIRQKEAGQPFETTLEGAQRKTQNIINNRRKKFVKRTWKSAPLLALSLINDRYPNYSEEMLLADLKVSKYSYKKEKFKKSPSQNGLRISQIRKLKLELRYLDSESPKYYKCCNKIVGYLNGIKTRTPIFLQVRYGSDQIEYPFPWNETEDTIKRFVGLSKRVKSFAELDEQWKLYTWTGN